MRLLLVVAAALAVAAAPLAAQRGAVFRGAGVEVRLPPGFLGLYPGEEADLVPGAESVKMFEGERMTDGAIALLSTTRMRPDDGTVDRRALVEEFARGAFPLGDRLVDLRTEETAGTVAVTIRMRFDEEGAAFSTYGRFLVNREGPIHLVGFVLSLPQKLDEAAPVPTEVARSLASLRFRPAPR